MREQYRAQHITTLPSGQQMVRCTFELESTGDGSLHIVPAGPLVLARDGRSFHVSDPARVIAASELPMLVDWEHRSEFGGETRAAGWISGLAVRPTGIYGAVTWTPAGLADVKSRAYRYLSPVLLLSEGRDVLAIASIALTNRPALHLSAIEADAFSARARSKGKTMTRDTIDLEPAARVALKANGLTDEQIQVAQAYRAERLAERAEASTPAADHLIDRELLSRGLSPAEIANARSYVEQRRLSVLR
jgi:phage I-like protein